MTHWGQEELKLSANRYVYFGDDTQRHKTQQISFLCAHE